MQFDVRTAGEREHPGHTVRQGGVDREGVAVDAPRHLDAPVPGVQRRPAPGEPAAGSRRDEHPGVPGFQGRDPADRPVHPVRHRAERVVVEAGHLPRVDLRAGRTGDREPEPADQILSEIDECAPGG
ncbi:hypothetical protein Areg01_84380 [Actinoplanes regularis]|nr:hypothetical protein Areg01_84380 [Actinoplanes regularis]